MHNNLGVIPANPFRFVAVSNNKKTGSIPVTSTAAQSCPMVCPMRTDSVGGCYASGGNTAIHWRTLSEGNAKTALDANGLFAAVRSIGKGELFRHNEAGDLLGDDSGNIDPEFICGLTKATKGKRGFTYTHHAQNAHNIGLIREANNNGFTVNISTNSIQHAIDTRKDNPGLPIVTLVPDDMWNGKNTIGLESGDIIVRCPAEYIDGMTCKKCSLCAVSTRKGIVGFTPHGSGKKRVINIAKG